MMQQRIWQVWLIFLWTGAGPALIDAQNRLDSEGRKTGPWRVEYPGGNTLYEATFRQGRPVGLMVRYYENGAVRARMMFDTIENRSYTTLYYKNGNPAAEGWYVEQKKDSVWTYYSELDKSVRIREPYRNGDLYGIVYRYYPGGRVSEEVTWIDSCRSGPWKQFYEDGSLRLESGYHDNKLSGPYRVYYADSTLKMSGAYRDNLSHGSWSYYDESGKKLYQLEYRNGQPVDNEKYKEMLRDSFLLFESESPPDMMKQN